MDVEFVAFGPLRDVVGHKELPRTVPEGATVGDLLADLVAEYPELRERVFDDDTLSEQVTVTRNGEHLAHQDGLETELEDGDVVRAAPPVRGG